MRQGQMLEANKKKASVPVPEETSNVRQQELAH